MRKNIICALLVLFCAVTSVAQPPRKNERLSPEDFREKMENAITESTGLTTEEAAKLFPLFHEMKKKQHDIGKQIFSLKKAEESLSEKELSDRLLKIKHLQVQMAEVEETYYKRMCKAVSATKVFGVMRAEDEFHREMLSSFNHKHRPNNPSSNRRP